LEGIIGSAASTLVLKRRLVHDAFIVLRAFASVLNVPSKGFKERIDEFTTCLSFLIVKRGAGGLVPAKRVEVDKCLWRYQAVENDRLVSLSEAALYIIVTEQLLHNRVHHIRLPTGYAPNIQPEFVI
jgi:hypothetical protein